MAGGAFPKLGVSARTGWRKRLFRVLGRLKGGVRIQQEKVTWVQIIAACGWLTMLYGYRGKSASAQMGTKVRGKDGSQEHRKIRLAVPHLTCRDCIIVRPAVGACSAYTLIDDGALGNVMK